MSCLVPLPKEMSQIPVLGMDIQSLIPGGEIPGGETAGLQGYRSVAWKGSRVGDLHGPGLYSSEKGI